MTHDVCQLIEAVNGYLLLKVAIHSQLSLS